jgi:hypothetical protein
VARRKAPEAVGGPVFGVLGLFRRTEEAWRALGAPPSLYNRDAACEAVRRCSAPAYSREFILVAKDPAGLNFVAQEWWMTARPAFLIRRDALTDDERRRIAKESRLYGLSSGYNQAAFEREVFGADHGPT